MKKRRLGHSGLEVSPLAFGGNVFGWTVNERTSFDLLDAFVDAGFNFIDTADVYSNWAPGNEGGVSETIIGNWLKRNGKRDKVLIATKVGKEMGPNRNGLSRGYIVKAAEDSLKRLRINTIDLYQSHIDDSSIPLEETLEAYAQLVRDGKVRAIGASNTESGRLEQAIAISEQNNLPRYESLQPLYNLYDREVYEKTLEPLCRRRELGVISYFSLASGFLTGKYRTVEDLENRARSTMVRKYLDARGMRIITALDEIARQNALTPAKVALAWLIAQPSITAPIASATNLEQLRDLIDATSVSLDEPSMALLDAASAYDSSSGAG